MKQNTSEINICIFLFIYKFANYPVYYDGVYSVSVSDV